MAKRIKGSTSTSYLTGNKKTKNSLDEKVKDLEEALKDIFEDTEKAYRVNRNPQVNPMLERIKYKIRSVIDID